MRARKQTSNQTGFTRRLRSERGALGLIELLVVAPLIVVVMVPTFALVQTAFRSQATAQARAATTLSARTAVERMTRELRQARTVMPLGSTGRTVDLQKCTDGLCSTTVWVRYSCDPKPEVASCMRYQADDGSQATLNALQDGVPASGTATTFVKGVVNSNVFDFIGSFDANGQPVQDLVNPVYMTVTLKLGISPDGGATKPQNPVEISDGVELRNMVQS